MKYNRFTIYYILHYNQRPTQSVPNPFNIFRTLNPLTHDFSLPSPTHTQPSNFFPNPKPIYPWSSSTHPNPTQPINFFWSLNLLFLDALPVNIPVKQHAKATQVKTTQWKQYQWKQCNENNYDKKRSENNAGKNNVVNQPKLRWDSAETTRIHFNAWYKQQQRTNYLVVLLKLWN